jgi:dynein heavy chain 1
VFEEEEMNWEEKMNRIKELLEVWIDVKRSWV